MDWRIGTGLWLGAAAMGCFAAHVMLALSRGTVSGQRLTALRSLLGAALAWSAGGCAVHFIALSPGDPAVPWHYRGALVAGAWLLAFACALGALNLSAGTRTGRRRRAGAAVALGTSACGVPVLGLHALQLSLPLDWQAGPLLLAWAAATALAALGLAVFPKRRVGHHVLARHLLASLALGAALLAGEFGALKAAVAPPLAGTLAGDGLGGGLLAALSSLAVPALLALLLLSSEVESRVKATLRRTRDDLLTASQTDTLTQLPNRSMFEAALLRAVQRADHDGHGLALLFINLDGLKTVNESFGQAAGDAVLCEMAQRLRVMAAPQDRVSRAGGDEFLLLLDGDPTREDAAHLANRLLKSLNEPWVGEGREVSMTCSVGIALYPEHGALSKLIAHAAAAMHVAKRNGGATYCFFEPSMTAGARDQVDLLRDLRRAIQQEELELYYQPKVHAPSGQITGAEALMRWHHPQRGMVGPAVFIPLAERFGLINAMGNWLIDESCRQIRVWREQGLRMRVSINLSVHQLRQDDLVPRITDALQRNRIEPHVLTCEVTESAAMDDTRATLKVIERLAQAGVHLSIDDFGTGYSSLSYLRQLPAGELKIDRSFVLDLETSADARAIVDAVVKLAQALGLKVVAEGVETEEQQKILRQLGCDELQGFLFAKPMSAKALALWAMEDEGPRPLVFRPSLFGDTLSPATV